jgi:hypothetical protein
MDKNMCAYCGGPIVQPPNGRPRKYCCASHRHAAWLQGHRERPPEALLFDGYLYVLAERGATQRQVTEEKEVLAT